MPDLLKSLLIGGVEIGAGVLLGGVGGPLLGEELAQGIQDSRGLVFVPLAAEPPDRGSRAWQTSAKSVRHVTTPGQGV